MADQPVIERIEGVSFTAGANQPFLLDEPDVVYWVESGFVDVFAVELLNEEKASRIPFVTRVPAGSMCFGAQRLAGRGGKAGLFSFLAVPSMDAVLVRGTRAKVASKEDFDIASTVWIDEWLSRLSEFVVRGRGPPPRDALLLDADLNVPYPAGSTVSAHHLDIVWVTVDQPMRFTGNEELVIPAESHPVPLSERTWLELESDARVSALYTPGIVVSGQLWPSLDRFSAIVLECAALFWEEKARHQEDRHRRLHLFRRAAATKMFGSLGRVLGGGGIQTTKMPRRTYVRRCSRRRASSPEPPGSLSRSRATSRSPDIRRRRWRLLSAPPGSVRGRSRSRPAGGGGTDPPSSRWRGRTCGRWPCFRTGAGLIARSIRPAERRST